MSEPIYEPNKWNKNKYILKSHNCYMYALNKIDKKIMNTCKKYIRNKKTFKKIEKNSKINGIFYGLDPVKQVDIRFQNLMYVKMLYEEY